MCGVLCGLQKYKEIETYGKNNFEFFHDYFGVENTPSDSTISRIMCAIDGDRVNAGDIQTYNAPIEKNGGKLEKRTISVCYDTSWLSVKDEWKGLKSVIMVDRTTTSSRGTTSKTRTTAKSYLITEINHSMHFVNLL
jgi:hypothetical protein